MIRISRERIDEIIRFAETRGETETVLKYKISYETLSRYRREYFKKPRNKKTLIFDIETAPINAYVWRTWKENISIKQIINDWFVLSWSAKWLNDSDVFGEILTPAEIKKQTDKRIIKTLWTLFDQADILIAHHGDKFDVPKSNTRFVLNGLKPPSPYKTIDTRKIAYKQFGFTSNKLDYLAGLFGIEHKMDTDFNLWVNCLNGDKESLSYMLEYNKKDVIILEQIYLNLRPYIKSHPNANLYQDSEMCCSTCGSEKIKPKGEHPYYASSYKYDSYECLDCGAYSRISRNKLVSIA